MIGGIGGKTNHRKGEVKEGSRKARKNEQRWKVARKKRKYDGRGGQEIGIERLRSNGGGGCGDGLRRGGEE